MLVRERVDRTAKSRGKCRDRQNQERDGTTRRHLVQIPVRYSKLPPTNSIQHGRAKQQGRRRDSSRLLYGTRTDDSAWTTRVLARPGPILKSHGMYVLYG
jgi:hypothetical protein